MTAAILIDSGQIKYVYILQDGDGNLHTNRAFKTRQAAMQYITVIGKVATLCPALLALNNSPGPAEHYYVHLCFSTSENFLAAYASDTSECNPEELKVCNHVKVLEVLE